MNEETELTKLSDEEFVQIINDLITSGEQRGGNRAQIINAMNNLRGEPNYIQSFGIHA